jgi:uncharacterized protein YggE
MTAITLADNATLRVRGTARLEEDPTRCIIGWSASKTHEVAQETLVLIGPIVEAVRDISSRLADDERDRFTTDRIRTWPRSHRDPETDEIIHDGHTSSVAGTLDIGAGPNVGIAVEQIIAAGAEISYVRWALAPDTDAYRRARKAAVAQAAEAAADFAEATGGQLGALVSLSDPGVGDPGDRAVLGAVARSAGGAAPSVRFDPKPIVVTASVEAVFTVAASASVGGRVTAAAEPAAP